MSVVGTPLFALYTFSDVLRYALSNSGGGEEEEEEEEVKGRRRESHSQVYWEEDFAFAFTLDFCSS